MTNEEAIEVIEQDIPCEYDTDLIEALNMAIAALKQPTDGIYITHKVYSDLCLRAAKAGDLERELAEKKAEPCCNSMDFPDTFEEFVKSYGIKDSKEVYTNGSVLISVFRVKQWLDHINPCEDRMKYVQETVNTMMDTCTTNSIKDKVFRNAARFVQNAIDGKEPDFERIDEPEPCEDCDKWETDKTACQKCGEPCGDAVKREAVLNTLDTMDAVLDENRTVEAYKELLKECYKELPSVTPKPCEDTISRKHLLSEIDDLMKSPWLNNGKDDKAISHYGYVERKEAVEVVRDLCVKAEPSVTPKQKTWKWIPLTWDESKCESSYPDDMDGCWAIFTDGKNISIERGKKDAIDHFFPSGRWFEMSDAIAWMPLPEPWKGENE